MRFKVFICLTVTLLWLWNVQARGGKSWKSKTGSNSDDYSVRKSSESDERRSEELLSKSSSEENFIDHPEVEEWSSFVTRYGKSYESEEEETIKKTIYSTNIEKVLAHNTRHSQGLESYRLGVNENADLTPEEYSTFRKGLLRNDEEELLSQPLPRKRQVILPSSIDWRTKGYVTKVKNQGSCGSCWSFATTGAVEGQLFAKTGRLVSLSEQNLIDCSLSYGNHGCYGGYSSRTFQYIRDNGIETEDEYPYQEVQKNCQFTSKKSVGKILRYVAIQPGNETALMEAVGTVGPIAIAIDASLITFQLYRSGVYDDSKCTTSIDHAVLAVGYGSANGQPYWLVKNSWGTSWGESGFIKMARNQNNHCGIASQAAYPIL